MKYRHAVPVVSASDVLATVDYYTNVLGFQKYFVYGEPPVYAGVVHNDVQLFITLDSELVDVLKATDTHPEIFLWVDDVDKVFAEHLSRGATIREPVSDRPWDARQYVIEDPNGYYLKVAQPIEAEA